MSEEKTITVKAYRDKDGLPTCAVDFRTGEFCQFLRVTRFGILHVCAIDQSDGLWRRGGKGEGSLIPCEKCIAWKGEL